MTDPKRLIDGREPGGTLLASALFDAPRPGARDRAAEALGLAVGGAAPNPGAPSPGSGGNGVAGVPKGWAGMASGANVVWGLLVVATVTGAALVARTALRSHGRSPFADTTWEASERRAEHGPPGPQPLPEAPLSPQVESPLVSSPTGGAETTRVRVPRASIAQAGEGSLSQELHLLDVARRALDRADPGEALAQLDRHDRAFPLGALRAEASVLRVRALLARGDRERALALARELLAQDPSGPHARRLRELLEAR